jgi:hypothetical protein
VGSGQWAVESGEWGKQVFMFSRVACDPRQCGKINMRLVVSGVAEVSLGSREDNYFLSALGCNINSAATPDEYGYLMRLFYECAAAIHIPAVRIFIGFIANAN